MKITVDKHYSLEEIKNGLEKHFKNYKFKIQTNIIYISIPNVMGFHIHLKGKEIVLGRTGDFGDFILVLIPILGWLAIAGRNDLSNNVHAKEILDFIKNDLRMIEDGTNIINEYPSICPSCKNPNEKKLRICEWCGGKMV